MNPRSNTPESGRQESNEPNVGPAAGSDDLAKDRDARQQDSQRRSPETAGRPEQRDDPDNAEKGPGSASADVGMTSDGRPSRRAGTDRT